MKLNLKTRLVAGAIMCMVAAAPGIAKDKAKAKSEKPVQTSSKTVLVDPKASTIEWKGTKVTGAAHHGTIAVKEGEVQIDGKRLLSGKIVVDMDSIVNVDLTDAEYNKKLVGHLKSDDFFDVGKFPTSILVVKSAEPNKDGTYAVKGELTMKSETRPVDFVAKPSADGKSVEADLTFDRTVWNIRYGSGKFFKNLGDKMINDKVELKIKLGFSTDVFAAK